MPKIGVIGTTGWGTTLAILLAGKGMEVYLLSRSQEEAQLLSRERENRRRLPGAPFPPSLRVTYSPWEALEKSEVAIFAVPSQTLRVNIWWVRPYLASSSAIVVSAIKGLEKLTGKRMSEVLRDELPKELYRHITVLSGPNLSKEIIQGKPSSTVVASGEDGVASEIQGLFMSPQFRVYTSTDVIGVELGGSLKNIIAIGAGIGDGLGFGANAKAAFITRGLAEITRLGAAAGASPLTFAGLSGLGDLVATCFSPLSRNRYVGEELAMGKQLKDVLSSMDNVAEGVDTTIAALKMADQWKVEMPITQTTHRVLFEGLDPKQAVLELMSRAPGPEWPPNVRPRP